LTYVHHALPNPDVSIADFQKTIAVGLIDIVDSRASDLQREASALDNTLEVTIQKYEGLALTKRSNSSPISRIKRHLLPEAVAAN